jgi:hypothetical protein
MLKILLILLFIFFSTLPVFAQIDTAWVRTYDGQGYWEDCAEDIAVDRYGNIYVTGYSSGRYYPDYDYATIKYDQYGNQLWVRRYNGPGNGNDMANAIYVDRSGNAYVTGSSYGSEYFPYPEDWATIKYYSNGDTAWVRRYNCPANYFDFARDIAVDDLGNVYVTGRSFLDFLTIKYYPDGDTAWTRRYRGPENSSSGAYALTLDDYGNVYVVGESDGEYATVKYRSNGDTAWTRRYDAITYWYFGNIHPSIAVDGLGNVYVAGTIHDYDNGSYNNYLTISYNRHGNMRWVRTYNGPGNEDDIVNAIAVDSAGNVYVTGISSDSGTFFDYATIKYNRFGKECWVKRYNGPGNGWDEARDIAIDTYGNIYVAGFSLNADNNWDFTTIKYDSYGNELWIGRYNSPGNKSDMASAIVVDNSGNVYVTGSNGEDYVTLKYPYPPILCGDANGDGRVSLIDVVFLIRYLYKRGSPPDPLWKADLNCDGRVTTEDIVSLVNNIFRGEHPPTCCR